MCFWTTNFALIALRGIQIYCLFHCMRNYVGEFVVCEGVSMFPTINNNDVLIVDYISQKIRRYKKGDIIIFKNPIEPSTLICKRIIATDHDKVGVFPNYIYVPKNHVWTEGDNIFNSLDSRTFGCVSLGLVRGRAICKIYPLHSFEIF